MNKLYEAVVFIDNGEQQTSKRCAFNAYDITRMKSGDAQVALLPEMTSNQNETMIIPLGKNSTVQSIYIYHFGSTKVLDSIQLKQPETEPVENEEIEDVEQERQKVQKEIQEIIAEIDATKLANQSQEDEPSPQDILKYERRLKSLNEQLFLLEKRMQELG